MRLKPYISTVFTALIIFTHLYVSVVDAGDPSEGAYEGCTITLRDGNVLTGYIFHSYWGEIYENTTKTFPEIVLTTGAKSLQVIKNFQVIIAPKPLYAHTPDDERRIQVSAVEKIKLEPLPYDKKVSAYNKVQLDQDFITMLKEKPHAVIFKEIGQACPDPRALVSYNIEYGKAELNSIFENEVKNIGWKATQQEPFKESLKSRGIIHVSMNAG